MAYRAHMINTLYCLTGIGVAGSKTSAKRSSPRPLLVVHSGNTTTGLSTFLLISSKETAPSDGSPYVEGVCPNEQSIFHNDTLWKPVIGVRCIVPFLLRLIAADPVPVRRPGVLSSG
jgi:hypothetical protein